MRCSNLNVVGKRKTVKGQDFPQKIYGYQWLSPQQLLNYLYLQMLEFVKRFCFSFWPALIICQARTCRVGVHWPSYLISRWPSPPASLMPRLPAHCLHISIKSSVFLGSTPETAINSLLLFCHPPSCLRVDVSVCPCHVKSLVFHSLSLSLSESWCFSDWLSNKAGITNDLMC